MLPEFKNKKKEKSKMKRIRFLRIIFLVISIAIFNLAGMTVAQDSQRFQRQILVTTTEDELNSIFANDTCSLREAIILVNSLHQPSFLEKFGGCTYSTSLIDISDKPLRFPRTRITLKEGVYKLTRKNLVFPHLSQDTGNLNIYEGVEIHGAGPEKTIIDGSGIRDFDKLGGVFSITFPPKNPNPIPGLPRLPPIGELGLGIIAITDLTIKNGRNQASQSGDRPKGSAVFHDFSAYALTFNNVNIENSADFLPAVHVVSGGLSFMNSRCTRNVTTCIESTQDVSIENSIFLDNGTAVHLKSSQDNPKQLRIKSSILASNNRAIDAEFPEVFELSDSTVTGNTPQEGFAIEIRNDTNTQSSIVNSIIAGNFTNSPQGGNTLSSRQRNCDGFQYTSEGFNLVGSGCIGFGEASDQIISGKAQLEVDFAPKQNSPATDNGNPECPFSDIYGNTRDVDGDGDRNTQCDIGAVERQTLGQPQADLALSVNSGPNGYFRGVQVDHEIELRNNGPLVANEILVEISLPANASSISTTNPSCAINQGRVPFLSCIYGSLGANATNLIPFSFVISENQPAIEQHLSAQVRGAVNDRVTTNNALDITLVPFDVAVAPIPQGVDFTVTISESVDPVIAGENLEYLLTVTNVGTKSGKATLALTYPKGATPPENCDVTAEKAVCETGSIAANVSKKFLLKLKAEGNTTPIIEAVVNSPNDINQENNSATEKTEVINPPASTNNMTDLTAGISGSSRLQINTESTYKITLKNLSSESAVNSQLKIRLSDGLEFVERTFGCTDIDSEITCDLSNISALADKAINIKVATLSSSGTESIDVQLNSDTTDSDPSNNSDTKTIEVVQEPTTNLTFSVSDTQLERRNIAVGESNINVLQFQATGERASLTALNLTTRGTGQDATDLQNVKLWHDNNANGLVDDGDVQLAQGNFASDDGAVRLELTQPLNLSQPANLLVSVDVNSRLALGFSLFVAFGLLGLGMIKRVSRNNSANRFLNIILILSILTLVGCGGSTTKTPVTSPKQPAQTTQPTQPIISKQVSFQLTLESAEAIVPSSNALSIVGLPITGTDLTVTE